MAAPSVEIWRVELDAVPAPPPGLLSAAEQERAERIRDPAGGRHWAASRWALRELLGRRLGREAGAIELQLGANGKPELRRAPATFGFNVSHSGGLALVALAAGPVGVDVERIAPRRDLLALARRWLDPEAAAAVAAAPERERPSAFYLAWTRHEARLKCHGGGLGGPPPAGPVAVAGLDPGPGYAAAVAVPGERPPQVRLYRLELR